MDTYKKVKEWLDSSRLADGRFGYGRLKEISDRSGVPYKTLQKYAVGRVANPGIQNIEKLERVMLAERGLTDE